MSILTRTITVSPWQVALERYRGRPTVVLDAGRHKYPDGRTTSTSTCGGSRVSLPCRRSRPPTR